MKAERRHELQHNSLAAFLSRLPEIVREHGSKILLGIIIVLLVTILIYTRSRSRQEAIDIGWTNISAARSSLERVKLLPRFLEPGEQLAQARKQLLEAASNTIDPMLASDNEQIAAEAYLLLGDLHLLKANLTPIAAAATQPALQIEGTPEEHLARAQDAYEKVVRVYSDQVQAADNARFGLATIAENRRDFDRAQEIYSQIRDNPNTLPAYRTLAEMRLKMLDSIRKPVYLAPVAEPATDATTEPATAPAQ